MAGKLPERSQADDDDDDAPQCDQWSMRASPREREREKDLYQHVMLKSSLATCLQQTKQPLQLLHRAPCATINSKKHTPHTRLMIINMRRKSENCQSCCHRGFSNCQTARGERRSAQLSSVAMRCHSARPSPSRWVASLNVCAAPQ